MGRSDHSSSSEWAQEALEHFLEQTTRTDSTGVQFAQVRSNPKLAGTNGRATYRHFHKDTYHGPKQEDFLALANCYYQAASQKIASHKEQRHLQLVSKRLHEYEQNVKHRFPKNPQKMDADQLNALIQQEEKMLQQLITDFSAVVLHAEKKPINPSNLVSKGKQLRRQVQQDLITQGRPNAFHHYELPTPKSETPTERISYVTAIGTKTVPSSVRTGDHEGAPIANFVRRNYGYCKRTPDGKPIAHIEFSGITHSSYPPVDLFTEEKHYSSQKKVNKMVNQFVARTQASPLDRDLLIRRRAQQGVEKVLQELAQKAIAEGSTEQPLTLHLTTLSLVTPIIGTKTERLIRPTLSEERQLTEVMIALKMCQARGIITIEGPDGQPIDVRLDSTHINMPVNLGTKKKPYSIATQSTAHQYSNARGFFEYCQQAQEYFDTNNSPPNPLIPQGPLSRCLSPKLSQQNLKKERELRESLEKKYLHLYKIQEQIESCTPNEKKNLEKQYYNCLQEIRKTEKQHKNVCKLLNNEHKSSFIKNQKQADQELRVLEEQTKGLPSDDPKKQMVDTCRLLFDSQKIYVNSLHKTAENAYEFQCRYLLANERMGRVVEWFCKSAEDRAARTGEKVEETLVFHQHYDRFPSTPADQALINRTISPHVHNSSVNKEITNHNDPGARGLQVGSVFGSRHLSLSKIDKPMSRLAKHVYKIKDCMPSPTLLARLNEKKSPTPLLVRPSTADQSRIMHPCSLEFFKKSLEKSIQFDVQFDTTQCRIQTNNSNQTVKLYDASQILFTAHKMDTQTTITFPSTHTQEKALYLAVKSLDSPITVSSQSLDDIETIIALAKNLHKECQMNEKTQAYLADCCNRGILSRDTHPNISDALSSDVFRARPS